MPELDGVRGLAILLVIVAHYFVIAVYPRPGTAAAYLQALLINAGTGVDLFFVLSGFLIGGILLNNLDSRRYYRAFYARRFFRIFPPYYALVGLYFLAYAAGAQRTDAGGYQLFSAPLPLWTYPLYLQNFAAAAAGTFGCAFLSPTWSLAIEEQFYLLAPLAMRTARRVLPILLTGVIVTAYVTRIMLTTRANWAISAYVLSFCRFDALAIGILAVLAIRVEGIRAALVRMRVFLYLAFVTLGGVILMMSVRRITTASIEMVYYGYDAFALFYCLVILIAVTHEEGPMAMVFRFRPLRELGILAYGVYLLHIPVNGLCHELILHRPPWITNQADALVTLLAFALTVALARLSWVFFERPLLRIGRRFTYDGARPVPQVDPGTASESRSA